MRGLSNRVALPDQIKARRRKADGAGDRHVTDSLRDDHRLNSGGGKAGQAPTASGVFQREVRSSIGTTATVW